MSLRKVNLYRNLSLLLLLVLLVGCGATWQSELSRPDGSTLLVNKDTLQDLEAYAEEDSNPPAIPLERLLVVAGHRAVQRVTVVDEQSTIHTYAWASVADRAMWTEDRKLSIGGNTLGVSRIEVEPPARLAQVQADIVDIAPTVAAALGIAAPAQATGHPLTTSSAEHVLLLFLDGFGYVRYEEAVEQGLIPHLSALGEPLLGLTTYPPITCVSTASLLTGAPPSVHGTDRRGIRKTEVNTIFDRAAAAGLRVVAIEGESLAFNLRSAEMELSGDRDGNGLTDDNVLGNALAVLEQGMPDLFFVHFHGIDDAGHTYGPGTPEECARIQEEDAAVGQIIAALPANTLVIVFADHGMHSVQEPGRLGNHGHLIERDIFIPIWVFLKQ
jgi:hypothetical protein